jgi:hypothetical protein
LGGSYISYIAVGLGVASIATAGIGAYSSSQSAKKQASGEVARSEALAKLFSDRNPGASTMAGLEGLSEFQLNVNPLDFQDAGFGLTEDAQDFMFKQADKSFGRVLGSNRPLFDSFLTDNLERANYDFKSLPKEITRTLEGSALSRSLGGPAGLAENLSVENKIRLQQQGESSAFRALAFRQGFEPDILNPIPTVMALADFERQNQVSEAGIQMNALGSLGNLEMQRFGLEAQFQAPNVAGVNQAANANMWNAASQGLMAAGSIYGAYGGSMGRQQQPTIAANNYQAAPQYNSQYQNPFPGSTYNPNAYSGSVYFRG